MLALDSVIGLYNTSLHVHSSAISESAASSGAMIRDQQLSLAQPRTVEVRDSDFSSNIGPTLIARGSGDISLNGVQISETGAISNHLVNLSTALPTASIHVQGLVLYDNVWDPEVLGINQGPQQDSLETIKPALVYVGGAREIDLTQSVFRANVVPEAMPHLRLDPAAGGPSGRMSVVKNLEISATQGVGLTSTDLAMSQATLVGLDTALYVAHEGLNPTARTITIDRSILAYNVVGVDARANDHVTPTDNLLYDNCVHGVSGSVSEDPPAFLRFHRNLPADLWDLRLHHPGLCGTGIIDEPGAFGTLIDLGWGSLYEDCDSDDMYDDWEGLGGLEPANNEDADGADNLLEFTQGTLPLIADTDGDGLLDGPDDPEPLNPTPQKPHFCEPQ